MEIRDSIRVCRGTLRLVIVSFVIVWVSILTTCGLRNIWDDLHASWNNASRSATSGSVSRSCRSAKSFSQLLYKGLSDIISRNMDCISNTKDN